METGKGKVGQASRQASRQAGKQASRQAGKASKASKASKARQPERCGLGVLASGLLTVFGAGFGRI